MKHQDIIDKLSAYIDGELPLNERLEVENHIRAYPEIAELAERMRQESDWLSAAFDSAACKTDFAPAILEKLGKVTPDEIATVMLAKGRVEVRESDKDEWKPLINNSPVYPGEQVRTGSDARTYLLLEDGSEVWVNKNTHLKFPKYIRDKRWFQILTGEFLAFFHKQRDPFFVATPAGRVEVVGTEFDVAVPDANTTIISVVKGAVRYVGDLGERMIYQASQLKVRNGVEPGQSKPIRLDKFAPWARDLFAFAVESDDKLGKVTKGRLQTALKGGDNGRGPQPPFFRMAFVCLIIALIFGGWNYAIRPMGKNRPVKQKITATGETVSYVPYSIDQGLPVRDEKLIALQDDLYASEDDPEQEDEKPTDSKAISTDITTAYTDPFSQTGQPIEGAARERAIKKMEGYGRGLETLQIEAHVSAGSENVSLEFAWKAPNLKRMAFLEGSRMQEMLFTNDKIYQIDRDLKTYSPGRGVGFSEMLVLYCLNPMLFSEFHGSLQYNVISESGDGKYNFFNVTIKPETAAGNKMASVITSMDIRYNSEAKAIDAIRLNTDQNIALTAAFRDYKLFKGGFNVPQNSSIQMKHGNEMRSGESFTLNSNKIKINEYIASESFDIKGNDWLSVEHNPSSSVQRKTLENDPNNISAMYNLAKSNDVSVEEKVDLLEKALTLSPDHQAIMLELGKALLDEGDDFPRAESVLKKLLEDKPETQESYLFMARAFDGQKKYSEGVAYFKNMLNRVSNPKAEVRLYAPYVWMSWKENSDPMAGFGFIADRMERLGEGFENNMTLTVYLLQDFEQKVLSLPGAQGLESALEKASAKHRNNPFLQAWLGEIYASAGKKDKAEKILSSAAGNSADNTRLMNQIQSSASRVGIQLGKITREDDMDEIISKLKSSGNGAYQTLNEVGRRLKSEKNYDGIFRITEEFIAGNPQYFQQWSSNLVHQGGHDPAAFSKLSRAIKERALIRPNAVYFNILAEIEQRLNNYAAAAEYKAEAIRFGQDGHYDYYTLSNSFRSARNFDLAIQAMRKAIDLSPEKIYTYTQLAQLYKQTGAEDKLPMLKDEVDAIPVKNSNDQYGKATAYNELGEFEKAYELMMLWMEEQADTPHGQQQHMLREVARAMGGSGKYSFPENVKEKYDKQKLADITMAMIEQMMWSDKYKATMIHLRNGNANWNQSSHNFPAAVNMLAELDSSDLADEVSDPELLQRVRGLLAHYSGDFATARHFYGILAGKEMPRDQRYTNNRNGRPIWIDFQMFLKSMNGEGYEAGNGTITGKLRYYGRSLPGMAVYAIWNKERNNRWYRLDFEHPCGRQFYSHGNQNEHPPMLQTMTDADGKFTFINMPAGEYDFAFFIDNAVIGLEDNDIVLRMMGSRNRITLGGGQNLDLGWFDIIKPIEILNKEGHSAKVVYDDILPVEWEWEAPPEISHFKYQISASDIIGFDSNYYSNSDIREDAGTIPSFDLSMEDFSLNGDYSIRIRAIGPDNRELTSTSMSISIPKYEGLTSAENQAAKQVTYNLNNLWYSKKYQEYIDGVNDWLTNFPTSTKADDALVKIAYAYEKLGEKDKAIDVIERFIELYPENTVFKKRQYYNQDNDLIKLYSELTGADLDKMREEFAERQAEAPREFLPAPKVSEVQAPGAAPVNTAPTNNSGAWFGAMLDKSAPWIIVFLMAISIMAFLQGLARKK